jgi:hypothetical protein
MNQIKFFTDNYQRFISSPIPIDCEIVGSDHLYGSDEYMIQSTWQFLSKIKVHGWMGQQKYRIKYDILWSFNQIPMFEPYKCNGDNCSNFIIPSYNHKQWCVECRGNPSSHNVSHIVKIIVKGFNPELKFGHITKYITSVKVSEITQIDNDNSPKYAQAIIENMQSYDAKIKHLESELQKLKSQYDQIYSLYGFESREQMNEFIS